MALVPIYPQGDPALRQMIAAQQIGGAIGQFGDAMKRQQEQQALADLLAGTPGEGPRALGPGATEPGILASLLGGGQPGLGAPQGPPTAPTQGLIPGISQQEALALALNPQLLPAFMPKSPDAAKTKIVQHRDGTDIVSSLVDETTGQVVREISRGPWRPDTEVNVPVRVDLPAQETEREKILGKGTGERFNLIQDDRRALHEEMVTNDALVGLLNQGLQTGWTEELKARAADFGLNIPGAADIKAFQALAGDVTLRNLRRIPGPASDQDVRLAAGLSARAGNSPEANQAILAVNQAIAEYRDRLLALEEQHISRTGSQSGFAEARRQWRKDNPLNLPQIVDRVAPGILDQPAQQAAGLVQQGMDALGRVTEPFGAVPPEARSTATVPEIGAIEDGYRFLGGSPGDPRSWQRVQ